MENLIQTFENMELGKVRVIIKDNEPLFCLSDIAKLLEFRDGYHLKESIIREFEPYTDCVYPLKTKGGLQNFTFITEPQLYFCIMRSKSTKAKDFRRWVLNEVLPSIRKYGSYNIQGYQIPKTYAEALIEAGRLALENERLLAQAKDNEPKIKCFNELMDCKNAIDFLAFSKVIGVGRSRLFAKCRELSILMENNLPYQSYIDKGYFRVVEATYRQNDTIKSYTKTMILPKGQNYLAKKLKV